MQFSPLGHYQNAAQTVLTGHVVAPPSVQVKETPPPQTKQAVKTASTATGLNDLHKNGELRHASGDLPRGSLVDIRA